MRTPNLLAPALACLLASCTLAPTDPSLDPDPESSDEPSGSTSAALAVDLPLYADNALVAPWRDWSWSTTVAVANTDAPLAAGSKSQIKAKSNAAWSGLALAHFGSDLVLGDYDAITFDVRGAAAGTLQVAVEPLAGGGTPNRATIAVTTAWAHQTVKLSSIQGALTKLGKIDFIAPVAGQTYYVDNVRLVAKTGTAVAPAPTKSPTYPTSPLTVTKHDVVTLPSAVGSYSLYVPDTYDATHQTPTPLLLWMHGCGGNAYGDAWVVSTKTQSFLTVTVGGRDGGCWSVNTDSTLVLGALDDVKKRLNVDPRRVVIGGYSSGGDMAYRTAFYNAKRFAGIIAENTSPFRDSGSTQSASLAASTWKLNVAHLAHLSDTTYPIARVRTETDALTAAGYPMTRIERPGTHWDASTATYGTSYDLRTYLLPFLDAGWVAPP